MYTAKAEFLELLRTVQRSGVEELISFLESSDFFTAPASLKLYRNYSGGLCDHALCRYHYLKSLITNVVGEAIDSDSVIITALLSNLDKINYFEVTSVNKKVYCEDGNKKDDLGKFKWVAEVGYRIRDPEDRFVFGTSGQNAERIITNYMPLRDQESAAIVNLGVSYENPNFNYSGVYKKYPLACLLGAADQLATYMGESADGVPF